MPRRHELEPCCLFSSMMGFVGAAFRGRFKGVDRRGRTVKVTTAAATAIAPTASGHPARRAIVGARNSITPSQRRVLEVRRSYLSPADLLGDRDLRSPTSGPRARTRGLPSRNAGTGRNGTL